MIEKLKDKYVFFDIDGTLSEYRHNDLVYASKDPSLGVQTLENLLFDELFLKSRPLKTMQRIIEKLDEDKIFILGTVLTNHEAQQKYVWINKNFPKFKRENIIFVGETRLKPDVIIEFAKKYNWNIKETAFVDDRLEVLRDAELKGINAYHPSSFTE